jgi:hypothetical protein
MRFVISRSCTTVDQPDITSSEQRLAAANEIRNVGNQYFKDKNYAKAAEKYGKVCYSITS